MALVEAANMCPAIAHMTPERWKQTEELYHAARTRPPGDRARFLAEACPHDEVLRLDVESLLSEPESADGLLDTPVRMATHIAAEITPAPDRPHSGRVSPPGAARRGGHGGGVPRARLKARAGGRDQDSPTRDVERPGSPCALRARGANARSAEPSEYLRDLWPGRNDGLRFLILELVDGETLGQKLAKLKVLNPQSPGLPIDEVLTVARQIAEALEVAHDKGIIHRDLKPANVTLTAGGIVKVLDFGLAKPASVEASASDPIGSSQEGVILGTAAYMSPQQARGHVVDKRADIWSFGCVLYEMLTGHVAFAGETVSDTIGKILEREPDWSALPPTTPAVIQRLLRRCLSKDSRQRLRDIGDARIEIDAIDQGLPDVSDATMSSRASAKTRTTWLPWVALFALAASVGAWEARRGRRRLRIRSPTPSSPASRIGTARKRAPKSRRTGSLWRSSPTGRASSTCG